MAEYIELSFPSKGYLYCVKNYIYIWMPMPMPMPMPRCRCRDFQMASVLYFTMHVQNGPCATCCILMSHVVPWWQQVNVPHIEDKRKNKHHMCGKEHVVQIMIEFCQSKFFLMKKFQQSKKEQNNWTLIGNFDHMWWPSRLSL